MKLIDLDKLEFRIQKSTVRCRRLRISNLWKGRARITFTNDEYDLVNRIGITGLASVINHEFLHWILLVFIGGQTGDKKYDSYLESLGLYTEAEILENWL